MIVARPLFPAATVLSEINAVLSDMYPDLYGVVSWEPTDPETEEVLTYSWPFHLPNDARGVIRVDALGADGGWLRLDRWRWEPNAEKQLQLPVEAGTRVRVTYAREPGKFTTDDPVPELDWNETTGLPDRVADLVVLGVAARLAPFLDMGRLTATGIEPRVEQGRQVGVGADLSRQLMQQFQLGLQREALALRMENPIHVHKETGGIL